jgi:pimeloyl-ACP methyl ester carboxylesterase
MATFKSNGASLRYAVDGEGPAVILLHCLPLDHRMWLYQTFALSSSYKAISLDIRGLGSSPDELESCTFATLAEDVCNLMDVEGIKKATMVGLSFGGYVAQHLAVHDPDRVGGLVLSGTNPATGYEALQRKFDQNIERYSSADAAEFYRSHILGLFSPEFAATPLCETIVKGYEVIGGKARFASIVELFRIAKTFDLRDRLPSIHAPALVIAGERDRAYQDCKILAGLIPRCGFVSVAGSGHAVPIENPTLFNASLLKFLGKHASIDR